jgi:hypothetical protein
MEEMIGEQAFQARGRQRHFVVQSTDARQDNHPACRFSLAVVRLAHAKQGSY